MPSQDRRHPTRGRGACAGDGPPGAIRPGLRPVGSGPVPAPVRTRKRPVTGPGSIVPATPVAAAAAKDNQGLQRARTP